MQDYKNWIFLSGDDYWNSNPHSRYHIAKEFSKYGKILWVNSIGHRFPSLKKKKGWQLIFKKIKSYLIYFRKPEPNMYVFSPITIPIFRSKIIKRINTELLWLQINFISLLIGIKKKYFFVSSPSFGILSEKIKNSIVIYYYSDLYTAFRELKSRQETEELDKKLLSISVIIYGASKKICETLSSQGVNIEYLPHAVNKSHFEIINSYIPDELKGVKHPIIGYYGTITDSNDWDIIEYCSRNRPEYQFVFIGKKLISLPELEKRDNIHFIDKVPYKLIPYYGSQFDVAIMFWIMREWIIHSNPIKLLEYFALKKPVVSVNIPEVRERFGDLVFIANNKEEFLKCIDRALTNESSNRIIKYEQVLSNNTWEKVYLKIIKDLNKLLYV